jgi:glycosyltransferase involved in cell wall biosynthesis
MNTPEAARQLIESFPELASKRVEVGPVGWGHRDFATPIAASWSETFRIVHTGYLHTELGRNQRRLRRVRRALGGSRSGVDILTRSHVYLVRALDALVRERPDLRGRIELHLAGVQSDADRAVSSDAVHVRYHGYMEHPAAVELIRSADLLFLPMHDLRDGGRATIVPGKTYEYLASGRPILAAVPSGDARDLLAEAGSAHICGPSDERAMREILERHVDAWRAGTPEPPLRAEVVDRYEYGRLSRDLAAFFGAVAQDGSPGP